MESKKAVLEPARIVPDGTAEVLSNRMKEITTFWYIVMMKDSPGVSRYW